MFKGVTYEPQHDFLRLDTQLRRVRDVLLDCEWHTLSELQRRCGGSEAGVSARIRDLRHPEFGGYIIERRRAGPGRGLYEYRMAAGQTEMKLL